MQNIPYVRTAADLERKYNLSALPTIEKNTKTNQEQILKTNTMLEEFTAETIKNLENLQNQVDGNVTTYYYSGVPTLLNPPVSDWKEEEYNVHLGDLYYDKDTGYAYRFYLDTEPNVYGWVRITDSDITEALAIANTAQDTADAKRRVFVVEPKPPYDVGDIWFKEDKDLFRCKLGRQKGDSFNNSDWILATNYTDDTAANEAKAELSDYKVYVETTYETQADFIKEKEALELKVSKVETVANDKNKVFTSEPKTPYLPGDVYIKETTIDGMKQNLIYVCQTGRESGDYNPNDFSLQPSYASQSDLKLTDNKIAGVVQSVEDLEKEVTTTKETTGNNNLYIEDALESRVQEYGIDGKSEQETRSGKNLYNSATITSVSNGTNNNGVITSNTFSTNYLNLAPYNIVDLEAGTYYFSADIRIISGTPTISKINDYITDATVVSKPTLSTTKQRYVYKKTYTSATQLTRMLFQFSASANAVVEVSNIMISKENTTFEQYGASPSPDFPSEIKNVDGIRNLWKLPETKTLNGVTLTNNGDGTITLNGTATANADFYIEDSSSNYTNGEKYYISSNINKSDVTLLIANYNGNTYANTLINSNGTMPFTMNTTNDKVRLIVRALSGKTFNNTKLQIQLEKSSIPHSFVPYGNWLKVQTTGKNIFDKDKLSVGYLNADGTIYSGDGSYRVSDFISVKPNTIYYKGITQTSRTKFYNKNKQPLNTTTYQDIPNGANATQFTTPNDAYYLRVSIRSQATDIYIDNLQIEQNDKATTYEPYQSNQYNINLLKENLVIDNIKGYINSNSSTFVLDNASETFIFNVEQGKTYIRTCQKTLDRSYIGQALTENIIQGAPLSNVKTLNGGNTFTSDFTGICVWYVNSSKNDEIKETFKVYEGTDQKPTYELCSIGNIKDTLNIDDIGNVTLTKRIGSVVLNGSEALTQNSGKTCYYYNSSMFPLYDDKNKILSNYFKGATFNELYNATTDYGVSLNSSANRLTIRHKDITDLTQFKTWLSTHNTQVDYILEEPYTIDLGQVDISLFENINHINLLEDIETDTRLKYLTNTTLNGTYATKGELTIETNKIESSLNQKVSNEELDTTLEKLSNSITQEINNKENSILLKVSNDYSTKTETNQAKNEAISSANSSTDSKLTNYATNSSVNASLALKVGKDDNNQIVSMLNASANEINIKGDRFVLDSTNFKVDKTGNITAKNGKFTGGELILEDDGSSSNASIKIQTKDTSTGTTITRETTFSGYGIESDIVTNYDYTEDDVTTIQNIIINQTTPTQEQLKRYDITGDGKIDVFDMAKIQRIVLMRISKDSPGHFSIDTHASFNDNIVITNGLKEKVVSIGLNGIESQGGNLYYKDGDTYELTSFVGGGYVTGSGKGFNLGTLFTPKSLANINSVTLNEGGKLTVRQGGNYLVGSANGGATMSLTYCYAQKMGDNAIGIFYNAPKAPSGVINNDAIGVIMSDLSITLHGYEEETTIETIVD